MKKVCLCLVFLFLGVTVFSAAAFGQKRSITEKDLFNFRWIGNPTFQAPPSRCPSGAKKMRMLADAKTKVARPYLVGSAHVAIASVSRSGLQSHAAISSVLLYPVRYLTVRAVETNRRYRAALRC